MNLRQLSAILMAVIVTLNFFLFFLGRVSAALFWSITIVAAIFAYFVLPQKNLLAKTK